MKKTSLWFTFFCLFLWIPTTWAQGFHHRGGTLVIGRSADSVTLDPAKSSDTESSKVISNIFEGLVQYKDDSLEVEPALANAWENYNDGRMWIFHLRKGVRFHDGSPFNAEAVVFSIARQIDPKHPFFNKDLNNGCFTFKYVKEVKALDEYVVLIILEKTYAPFLHNLAMANSAPIVSPEAVKKWGNNDFERHPTGTGPFRFSEWMPNDRIVLTENREYWGGRPRLDKVIFRAIPNVKERFKEFQKKHIDVIDGLTAGQFEKLKKNSSCLLLSQASLNIGYLAMNVEKKPFDQLKVRQAINHAVNKRKLISLFYNNMAIRAVNPTPPVISGYSDNTGYAFNPRKARQMLKEAGYENGFETTLWVMKSARPYMPEPLKIAESLRRDLAAVGIKARLVSYEWKTYLNKLGNGEH
ncbi:MAG: ABC transporter substrate-binding protein, partial [Smithella sp.]